MIEQPTANVAADAMAACSAWCRGVALRLFVAMMAGHVLLVEPDAGGAGHAFEDQGGFPLMLAHRLDGIAPTIFTEMSGCWAKKRVRRGMSQIVAIEGRAAMVREIGRAHV